MKVTLTPSSPKGSIKAISSKSAAHRLLICSAFADTDTAILCNDTNNDIEATARCLSALGAKIRRDAPYYYVSPIKEINRNALLDCGESGSTLRFLVPIAAALGADADFLMSGRLPLRPLSPMREELEVHGITFSPMGSNPLSVRGRLSGNKFSITGNVSSQFISGFLFALSLLGQSSTLEITGNTESLPYIEMTENALSMFSVKPQKAENIYSFSKDTRLSSPKEIDVEGDWSNAAFIMAAGALSEKGVTVRGISPDSLQGDKEFANILSSFGAKVVFDGSGYTVSSGSLKGITLDASQIPDLVPITAAIASVSEGTTKIYGASRLRIKESDRLATTTAMLRALGADIEELDDGLIIHGKKRLSGGITSSFADHRIAMSAAIVSAACLSDVTVENAEAVEKSYPAFWQDLLSLNFSLSIS